jgi:hypothetical protein
MRYLDSRILFAVGLALSLGTVAALSPATAALFEGFEDPPTLGSTDGTGDFDPQANNNPHGTNVNGAVSEATPEGVQVRTDAVPPGPAEVTQYLRITEGDHYIPFLSPDIPNSQDFTVTFWVYNSFGSGLNFQVGRINTFDGPNIGFSNIRWEGGSIDRLINQSIEGPGPSFPWASITDFTSGQWDRIGLEYQASGTTNGTFNLYINNFTTPVASNLFVNNPGFSPPLNNVFFGTRSGAGEIFIDRIEVFQGPIPAPAQVQIATADVDSEFGVRFLSETSKTYSLEFTTDLVTSSNYQRAGALLEGTGGTLELFDPTGFSTSKAYRVAIE